MIWEGYSNIVQDVYTLIQNKLTPAVPRRWLRQFSFGLEAFSLRPFQSAGSNARTVVANPATASTKCDRLLANQQLAAYLGNIFDSLKLVKLSSFVNVDHSDLHGLTALVGAIQTRNGRAIPCMVDTTYAHHIPASGSRHSTARTDRLRRARDEERRWRSFTGHTIDALQDLHDRLGFWPRGLVFDRGFGNESIIKHLVAKEATFYIRLKAGRYCELAGERLHVSELKHCDQTVTVCGLTLRVIRSPKGRRSPEPWYILTNDFGSSRTKVVQLYYHRFEIEETFRDMKQLFEYKRARFLKPTSLQILWWLVALGIALLYVVTKPTMQQTHAKKRISWLRRGYEQLQLAYGQRIWHEEQKQTG